MKTISSTFAPLALCIGAALLQPAVAADLGTASAPAAAPRPAHVSLTAAQLTEMQARIDLANTIAQNVAADAAAKGADANWRMGLLASLYNTSSASLRNIAGSATTLDQAQGQAATSINQSINTASLAKDLGSTTDSLVFTPIAPCRFVDTRNVGGAITTPRDFDTFALGQTYGGTVGCTVPGSGEPGIAVNVTAVVPPGNAGFLGIRPFGSSNTTSFLNWQAGGTTGLANAGIVSTGLNLSNHYAFEVFAGGGNAPQIIVDYFGYFAPVSSAARSLDCYGTTKSVSAAAGSNTYYVSDACAAGYVAVTPYCWNQSGPGVLAAGSGINANSDNGTSAFCAFNNQTGLAASVTVGAQCCRQAAY